MTNIVINKQEINLNTLNKYIICNSTNISEEFKDIEEFVDLVVTSPPYFDAKVYSNLENQTGYDQTYEEYLNDIRQTFIGVYNICKPTASLYLNIDTLIRDGRMLNIQSDIINILTDIGWVHRDTIIWDKVKTLPYNKKGQMRNQFEYILFFTKQPGNNFKYNIDRIRTVDPMHWWIKHPEKYSPKGVAPSNIWQFSIPAQGSWGAKSKNDGDILKHVCPFPPEMMARIIKLSSDEGDVVLDPYSGTGIFLAVADRLNRKYLGLDISKESKLIFENATQKFVDSKWSEIESYYKVHEYLKTLYEDTIINLRILKYSRMLIKKINEEDVDLYNSLKAVYVNREKLTEKEAEKKYCKASFKIVIEDITLKERIKEYLEATIVKAPFSKYSLIAEIDIVSIKELQLYLESEELLYIYKNGEFTYYSEEVSNIRSITLPLSEEQITMNIDGINNEDKYPIIISKIKLHQDNYKLLLEFTKQQEKEKNYTKIVKEYNL